MPSKILIFWATCGGFAVACGPKREFGGGKPPSKPPPRKLCYSHDLSSGEVRGGSASPNSHVVGGSRRQSRQEPPTRIDSWRDFVRPNHPAYYRS